MAKIKVDKTELAIAEAEVFDVDPHAGLDDGQVAKRREKNLTNQAERRLSKTYLQIIIRNVFNVLNLILAVMVVLMIWAGLPWPYYLFVVVLLANIVIGLVQDIHARRLVDKLKGATDSQIKVVRNGTEILMDPSEIVLSDILVLEAGERIPADCILALGDCKVDESIITGEAEHIEKNENEKLFSGSIVLSGRCYAKVVAIGEANYANKIEKKASAFSRPSSEISFFVWRVALVCAVMSLLFFVVGLLSYGLSPYGNGSFWDRVNPIAPSGKAFIESFTGSVVAMLPAGMFLLTSLSLTIGIVRLSKRRVLVEDAHTIESLARINAIAFDKTGTLTDGTMSVVDVQCMKGFHRAEVGYAISSVLHFTKDSNSTACALREYFGDHSAESAIYTFPFDSTRKNSYIKLDLGTVYALGAYEFLPISKNEKIEKTIAENAKKGIRSLVLAIAEKSAKGPDLPSNMKIAALISLTDHLREDAKDNVSSLQKEGVDIFLLSGDDAALVSYLGSLAGVTGYERYVNLTGKTDEEVLSAIGNNKVFGRATPEQKALVVAELRRRGHKVAMVGDGINDILAMKEADASIAMASGSSAAKTIANFTALDSEFSAVPEAMKEGRRTLTNLESICSLFLTKTLFALLVATISLILSFFLKMPGADTPFLFPFSTANLVVWEVFAIGIPSLLLVFQQGDDKPLGKFVRKVNKEIVPAGFIAALIAFTPFVAFGFAPDWFASSLPLIRTFSVVAVTAFAYVFLGKVFFPMNRYRLLMYLTAWEFGLSFFALDCSYDGQVLGFVYEGAPLPYFLLLFATIGVAILIYAIVLFLQNFHAKEKKE